MGFSRERSRKALAATGGRDARLAADWILAHVNDSTLDHSSPRNFVVYLCPKGKLQEQCQTFWDASKVQVGVNGAHKSLPHMTLTPTFVCPDENVENLVEIVREAALMLAQEFSKDPLCLEKYQSPNFFGLFVAKHQEDKFR